MRNLPNLPQGACQDLQRAREAGCRARTLSTQLLAAQLAAPDEQLDAALGEVRQTMDRWAALLEQLAAGGLAEADRAEQILQRLQQAQEEIQHQREGAQRV